jgi:hypothetical protein
LCEHISMLPFDNIKVLNSWNLDSSTSDTEF